jgi:hypothetical protein
MIPDGELLRSRVVTDLAAALEEALDRHLDGYAVVTARDTLLGSTDQRGVVTFEDGVPTLAYHAETDRGGPPALADIGAGPYRLELYALDDDDLEAAHRTDELRVPPGMVAERLAGAPALADRARQRAASAPDAGGSALEAFLEDETAIEELRTSAREEATRRAEEWGFEDAI